MYKEASPLEFLSYNLLHSLEIYIGRRFLKNGCNYQQVTSTAAKEFPISYNLIQRPPKTQNL